MKRCYFAIFMTLMLIIPAFPLVVSADEHGTPDDIVQYQGSANLVIHDDLVASQNITATWSLNISISDYVGTSELPHPGIGIRSQIDQYLGDSDGNLSQTEVDSFSQYIISARNWTDSEVGGCCILDHESFTVVDMNISTRVPSIGPVWDRNGTWGWTEESTLIGATDSRSTRLIDLPRVGNVVEEIPLTIILPMNYEFHYSAMQEIIQGTPGEFTVNRSAAPVASNIRISVGENSDPHSFVQRISDGSQVPLDSPTTYEGYCQDSALENTQINWDVSNNGTFVYQTNNTTWITINPSELGYQHGEVLSVVFRCRDSFGGTSTWYENVVIDGVSPTWEASFMANPTEGESTLIDISDGIIEIGSEDILDINITAVDDSGLDTTIEITSNRTSEWRHVDWNDMFAQSKFPQGEKVNGLHLDINSRHEEKPETRYSLNLTVMDDSGNRAYQNWTILVLDQAGPEILPDIYYNGTLLAPENPVRAGERIQVNLTNSYDDIDSIMDTRWTFILNQEKVFENMTYADVSIFDVEPLEAGSHWFILMAWDSKDNVNLLSFSLSVQPAPGVDIRFWNLSYYGEPVIGNTISVHAIMQNLGGDAANGRLCSGDVCSQVVNVPWATSVGPGIVEVDLELPLENSGAVDFRFEWGSSQLNLEGEVPIDSDIQVRQETGPLQTIILVFVVIAGLSWLAHRLWGTEKIEY